MVGHKICFYGEIWLIVPKLSLLIPLIWRTVLGIRAKIVFRDELVL